MDCKFTTFSDEQLFLTESLQRMVLLLELCPEFFCTQTLDIVRHCPLMNNMALFLPSVTIAHVTNVVVFHHPHTVMDCVVYCRKKSPLITKRRTRNLYMPFYFVSYPLPPHPLASTCRLPPTPLCGQTIIVDTCHSRLLSASVIAPDPRRPITFRFSLLTTAQFNTAAFPARTMCATRPPQLSNSISVLHRNCRTSMPCSFRWWFRPRAPLQ